MPPTPVRVQPKQEDGCSTFWVACRSLRYKTVTTESFCPCARWNLFSKALGDKQTLQWRISRHRPPTPIHLSAHTTQPRQTSYATHHTPHTTNDKQHHAHHPALSRMFTRREGGNGLCSRGEDNEYLPRSHCIWFGFSVSVSYHLLFVSLLDEELERMWGDW